ncbi:hypothetical protein PG995_012730 [Apiospora arundinis]
MASTSASTSGSPVAASAPPAAGQQQPGFHAATLPPQRHTHVQMGLQQQQHTFHLTPEMEEGIKAAVAATNPDPASHARKTNNGSAWNVAKYFLRYTILLVAVGIVLAEIIIAIIQRPDMDTAVGVIWGLMVASWHTWRLVRIIKKKGSETITPVSLIIDGLLIVAVVICFGLLLWRLIDGREYNSNWGYGEQQARGVVLLIIMFVVGIAQSILFRRSWVEHEHEHGHGQNPGGGELAKPAYPAPPPAPPAQIVVHYVQNTCPKCGTQSWPQPGEELNEHIANKGDMQPQAIPLEQLQQLPRAAG